MNLKTELVALAVRVLAEKNILVRKPDTIETFVTTIFGGESYDRRLARDVVAASDQAVAAVKRIKTNREFKKITANI